MAGSRLEKFGTVFTRVRDLMRSGVIRPLERPVWYEVFKAFPPKKDPLYVTPKHARNKQDEIVNDIFYQEDQIRAKFYKVYGTGPRVLDLSKSNYISPCQRFVETYTRLASCGEHDEEALFQETGKALLTEGLVLRRRGASVASPELRDPVLEFKLTDMLAEQQQSGTSAEK
ncbi:hypothetical protein NHX12_008174 [Muraenolepis orangiensis]|uniref:Small ribosomal subunit protein mS23 n=1 Tax=Muraenolepis orangiensis TaxID=630683 RepID=A0A9Q0DK91_9TELE|nr:hypothetical protein NHX12_008174 [Muraenolepis orangiensis]